MDERPVTREEFETLCSMVDLLVGLLDATTVGGFTAGLTDEGIAEANTYAAMRVGAGQ